MNLDGKHFCAFGNNSFADKRTNHLLASQNYPEQLNSNEDDVEKQNEPDDELCNLQNKIDTLTANMTSMKSQLENCERDKDMLKAKLTTSEEDLKIETSRHEKVREELQKMKQNLHCIETQHAQEKKMCLEISQAHEECEHELRAEIQCLKQDVREKDEEINRQKVEIEDLIAQLEERKFVSEEQDKVIDHFLSGNFFQGASGEVKLNMYDMELTIHEVDEQTESLRRMREQLDEDRRRFTENTIKLGWDRVALRAERDAFEEEKRSLQTRAMLLDLEEMPSPNSRSSMLDSGFFSSLEHSNNPSSQKNRGSVTSTSMKENFSNSPSSTVGQRSARAKMQQLQMANAKFWAKDAVFPSPAATSSRSLAAIVSKAAASAVSSPRRPPARVAKLVSLAAHSHNTNPVMLHTSSNSSEEQDASSESANFVKRSTSAKLATSIEKKVAA